jgi:hypothetical protein
MLKIGRGVFSVAVFLLCALACDSSTREESDVAGPPTPSEPDFCAEMNLGSEPFQAGDGGFLFGDLAEDFTVKELGDIEWTLSERWTGCDSYIFFSYFEFSGGNGKSYMDGLWSIDFKELIEASAKNVHYFFVSSEVAEADRISRLQELRLRFLRELNLEYAEDPEARAHWVQRFHFVSDRLTMVSGSVGGFVSDYLNYKNTASPVDLGDRGQASAPYPMSFAIGRDQRWDATGSLSEHVGGPESLKMIAYNSAFYNHRAQLRARLAAETETRVLPLMEETVTARVFLKDVTFPEASELNEVDTLEFDVAVTCPHRNPFGCSEWDRIARISLCTEFDAADAESCTASTEVVRWITPYWRRGRRRWVMDASPFVALVQAGGVQRFRVEMGPSWERGTERHAAMSVRLSNKGTGYKSQSVLRAFGGGTFNADYNTGREPFKFTPPADAKRVELVTIVSGHGQTESDGCAEWCNHVHQFRVNASASSVHEISYSDIGNPTGCAARANEGVVPGQWGNWSQSRAGWCPGLPVETIRKDISDEVTLGEENSLTYEGSFRGGEPKGGDITMNAYVVWYRE